MLTAMVALSAIQTGLGIAGGITGASAQRAQARAQMDAIKKEWAYNISVLKQNKIDQGEADKLSAYSSGLEMTGSTAAVAKGNLEVLQRDIEFQNQQYRNQYNTAKAASKQKYLGIF
jgi:hypothetical protein